MMPNWPSDTETHHSSRGQATILVLGGLAGLLIATVIIGAVARAVGHEAAAQRAADLAAVAAGRVMHDNYGRLFEPAFIRRRPNPNHLEKADYLALGRQAGQRVARANGAANATVSFPDEATIGPVRVRVAIHATLREDATVDVVAEAELGPSADLSFATGGGYDGPLATRQGERMRPDVALAFDRMDAAARADGITLAINSGYRSDAEQAVLWARHPDPKWVARPGQSLHRNGTELDLGPPSAYAWLAANATRFHFLQRYAWEPWHFGYTLNPGSTPRNGSAAPGGGEARRGGGGTRGRDARETRGERRDDGGGERARREAATGRPASRTGRCRGSCPRASPRCCAPRRSAGTCPRSSSPRSSTPSRRSIRSRSPGRARRGSRSSCPRPRGGWGSRTRSIPSRRSTPRRT